MDDLTGAGVDALHPIQAGTMDDTHIATRYGGRVAFWVGMDVQQVIPFGTPADVRRAVRARIRAFQRPDGGLILAAGNAILPDTPVENLRAYLETLGEPIA
jgi:uroporphyrinogen decarboxylase